MDRSVDIAPRVERREHVKQFYSPALAPGPEAPAPAAYAGSMPAHAISAGLTRARVAVYDAPGSAPRVTDLEPAPVEDYIGALASMVYSLAKEQGGDVPYSVIREIVENLIHADFSEPVVSILEGGRTIRFSDAGPGIPDKDRAILPGFTTATSTMKRHIRGVGSGLPIVRDFLRYSGGTLRLEDNLGAGTVVTVTSGARSARSDAATGLLSDSTPVRHEGSAFERDDGPDALFGADTRPARSPALSTRQKQVLALVMESGAAGPSIVSRELGVGVSTAYRDLASLEELGLIRADGGKRSLTDEGLSYLDALTSGA